MQYYRTRYAKVWASALLIVATGLVFWLHCSPEPHHVTLTWQPPSPKAGITVVGYNVYRRVEDSTEFIKIATHVRDPHYDDTVVDSGRTYVYAVTSVDQSGHESRFSEVARAKVP